jgi:hypothetical protein
MSQSFAAVGVGTSTGRAARIARAHATTVRRAEKGLARGRVMDFG